MTDADIVSLQKIAATVSPEVWPGRRSLAEAIPSLVREFRTASGRLGAEDELRAVAALCLLGPEQEIPPPVIRADFLRIALEYVLPDAGGCLDGVGLGDLAVAVGCGWSAPRTDHGPWFAPWERALHLFVRLVDGYVQKTDDWFRRTVLGYRDRVHVSDHKWADSIAMELIRGACSCGHVSETMPDRARRRRARCLRQHSLNAWDPGKPPLRNFVAQAVKGSRGATSRFHAKAVAQGMLFPWLRNEEQLRFAPVLVWACDCPSHPKTEDGECIRCKNAGNERRCDESTHRRLTQRRFVFEEHYEESRRWHCRLPCGNFYRNELATCPLEACRRPRGGRGCRHSVVLARIQSWPPEPDDSEGEAHDLDADEGDPND
jgi:hypothetical protein